MRPGIHPLRLLLRKPYKILLCCLVNLAVILFTVIEGIQMTETRAAMNTAMASRFYTGTLAHTASLEDAEGVGYYVSLDTEPIGGDAVSILENSPWVRDVHACKDRAARFGGGIRYVSGAAASWGMAVGRASGEVYESRLVRDAGPRQLLQFRITYLAAGDPDGFPAKVSESIRNPIINFTNYDETLPDRYHHGERYFVSARAYHTPRQACSTLGIDNVPPDQAADTAISTIIVGEEPGDEALTDAEFAAKVMREYGLEEAAARLNDTLDMADVTEIPTLDMLLPWRNNLMRIVSGRGLTEKDAGEKVCMLPASMLTALRKKVGDTILLSLADGVYQSGFGTSGVPIDIFTEYETLSYGPMEEYEIVGSYANDESAGVAGDTRPYYMTGILLPAPADADAEGADRYHFSFTVHKDDYESFLFETEAELNRAGYTVIMARPEYADVEKQFEDLRSKTFSTFLTAALALGTGLAIAAGSLVLFWRSDYLTERRLGARKREAAGLYFRAYGIVAAVSLTLSALVIFLLGKSGRVPFLMPKNLSPNAWGNMVLFAAAELLLYAFIAFRAVRFMDRRKFGG